MDEESDGRKRPWSKRGPDGPWDAIVIGSGMGGMTSAALLARLGRRVLVLEQHYVPGGFTHVFRRKGYVWDVGVHAVGEVTTHSLPGRVLADLTRGSLRWTSLGPVYDRFDFPGGFGIDFPDTPAQFEENLRAAFPREAAGIRGYLAAVREVAGSMRGYYLARAAPSWAAPAASWALARKAQRWLERRTSDVLAGFTADPRLKAVLTAQWGYYGSPPARSSFAMQALVTRHFLHGGYYPEGGSGEIARGLLQTVADSGGWTRICADVKEILLEGGRAVGVRLADGEEIRAKAVISAAGVLSTVRRLLPAAQGAGWARSVASLAPAPAHVCLYVGFKGDIRAAGASPANRWFYTTWDETQDGRPVDAWDISTPAALPDAPVLYCSFPSLKDPRHDPGPDVRHTGEVVTFVPWADFEPWRGTRWRRRGEDYDALKARLQERLLDQFLRSMPALAPYVDYAELSTPLSTDHFVRPVAGSIYGLEPTPERFQNPWLRPRSPIPGLYFSGAEVSSVGVIGAMMGGVLAAAAAEPMEGLRYLRGM